MTKLKPGPFTAGGLGVNPGFSLSLEVDHNGNVH